jgi:hypothetical protein
MCVMFISSLRDSHLQLMISFMANIGLQRLEDVVKQPRDS